MRFKRWIISIGQYSSVSSAIYFGSGADISKRSLQAWLMYRFEVMSSTSTFLITLLALYTGVSPGLTAFLLTAAAQCTF